MIVTTLKFHKNYICLTPTVCYDRHENTIALTPLRYPAFRKIQTDPHATGPFLPGDCGQS